MPLTQLILAVLQMLLEQQALVLLLKLQQLVLEVVSEVSDETGSCATSEAVAVSETVASERLSYSF